MATGLEHHLPGVVKAHHAPGPRPVRLVRACAPQLAPELRALLLGLERGVPAEDDEEGGDEHHHQLEQSLENSLGYEVMIGVLFIQFISPGLDDEAVLLTVLAAVCVTLPLSPMVLFP